MISNYTYEQALATLQINMESHAKFLDFVKTKPSKNLVLFRAGYGSYMPKRMNLNQRQKRKSWAQNPHTRPKANKR
jgi:hypothetical protein